jgi:hypothetical protein
MVGLKALGLTETLVLPEVEGSGRYEPNASLESVYRPGAARFARLYAALEDEFTSAAQERSKGEQR